MSTTPGRAIGVVVIGVVAITIAIVLKVVGQGEQEASRCAIVVVVSAGPGLVGIATDQFSSIEFVNGNRGSFVVTPTVECGRTGPMNAAFVAEDPVLVWSTDPFVDLDHMSARHQGALVELVT